MYSRWINPTVDAAAQTLNNLEGGQGTLLFSSGMAAITNVLFATLSSGDHVVSIAMFLPTDEFSFVGFFFKQSIVVAMFLS